MDTRNCNGSDGGIGSRVYVARVAGLRFALAGTAAMFAESHRAVRRPRDCRHSRCKKRWYVTGLFLEGVRVERMTGSRLAASDVEALRERFSPEPNRSFGLNCGAGSLILVPTVRNPEFASWIEADTRPWDGRSDAEALGVKGTGRAEEAPETPAPAVVLSDRVARGRARLKGTGRVWDGPTRAGKTCPVCRGPMAGLDYCLLCDRSGFRIADESRRPG